MDAKTLVEALHAYDASRPRSLQKQIGVSSLGGCRRQVWHNIQGHTGSNQTSSLAAIMGTAIHTQIEKAFENSAAMIEHRIEASDGYPPATIDYYDPELGEVVDWKTIKMSGRDWFVSEQKRWQVQTYGFLLARQGFEVKTVTLVGIPRDGSEEDIIVHSEPYDPAVAERAFAWLRDLESRTEAPAPERDATSFCAKFCKFYGDLCNGIEKGYDGEAIVDDNQTKAALRYKEILAEEKALAVEKDGVKSALEGVAGITMDGIKVSWSSVAGRQTPDTEQITKLLGSVPMKQGSPSVRLTVK
jgi:Domain of unknown function DUF83